MYSQTSDSCEYCAKGTYQSKTGQSSCSKCPVGTYTRYSYSQGKYICEACQSMTYQDQIGQTSCKSCSDLCVSKLCNKSTGKCNNCIGGYKKGGNDTKSC